MSVDVTPYELNKNIKGKEGKTLRDVYSLLISEYSYDPVAMATASFLIFGSLPDNAGGIYENLLSLIHHTSGVFLDDIIQFTDANISKLKKVIDFMKEHGILTGATFSDIEPGRTVLLMEWGSIKINSIN